LQDLLDDTDTLAAPRGEGRSGDVSDIIVENVSFRHPRSSRQVLRDISLTVKQGETVAIVGRNGAGKSTLLDLFLRFYDPLTGRIVAGDIDLRDWDLDAWRNLVGVMTQEIFLFHATIAENIGYGRPEAGREEIELAARTCGIEPLIRTLPKGFDTAVGERGAKLSGGQRQMVALARLFLRNAPILILDEPTAHLDGETLSQVGAALKQLMVGRTTFLVAHRSETVRLAGRIIVLDKGRIVAEGTHEALLADNNLYRKLMAEMGLALDGLPEMGEAVGRNPKGG
jgi:ABC-type multidrug transport system fused ATPase/permease subunit